MVLRKTEKINGDALRAEIFRRKMSLIQASRKLELADNYFSSATLNGQIPRDSVKAIELILGIKPEKYVIDEDEPVQGEKQLEIVTANTDGDTIRNIDVEFIKFRARELKIQLTSLCNILGKSDKYIDTLRDKGAAREDFELMLYVLRVDPNDERLFRKPETVKEAEPEKDGAIESRFNQAEAKIAVLNRQVKDLREENSELRRQLDGQKRLASAIVGSLAKVGIIVDGNANGKKGVAK